jgi:hypothetical protein
VVKASLELTKKVLLDNSNNLNTVQEIKDVFVQEIKAAEMKN